MNHPGKELGKTLKDREITRSALAKHVGVSPSLITDIIAGTKRITPLLSVKLGWALGRPTDWFGARQLAYDVELLNKSHVKIRRIK